MEIQRKSYTDRLTYAHCDRMNAIEKYVQLGLEEIKNTCKIRACHCLASERGLPSTGEQ